MMAGMMTLILTGLLFALRTRRVLVLENLALRHQLAVLQRAAPRPRLRPPTGCSSLKQLVKRTVRWSYHVLSLVLVCEDDGRACVGARCARCVILPFALSLASDDSPAHDG